MTVTTEAVVLSPAERFARDTATHEMTVSLNGLNVSVAGSIVLYDRYCKTTSMRAVGNDGRSDDR